MTAADGTRLDPRLTALFDAGATWATEPTDQRGYGDALRDAVERATTLGDDRGRELADALALAGELLDGYLRDRRPRGAVPTFWRRITEKMRDDYRARLDRLRALAAPAPRITRQAVMDAVDATVVGECPGAAVADRLGLTEGAGQ